MSKKRAGVDNGMVQLRLPLSDLPTARKKAGSLRVKEAVKEALSAGLEASGLEREFVASELSRLVGEPVNIHTLNSWTAESKSERRLPLEYAGALCAILGNAEILAAALEVSGYAVLGKKGRAVYELGLLAVEKKQRSKREKELWERVHER